MANQLTLVVSALSKMVMDEMPSECDIWEAIDTHGCWLMTNEELAACRAYFAEDARR